MPETRFEELKRYVRFDAADARALLAFRPVAEPHFVRVAREFYERIREHEEAHAIFSGEAQIERLQRSMVRWMNRLLSGTYDEAYRQQTLSIGRMHVRVGLPQHYMFTAMALIRVALEEIAADAPNPKMTRTALTKLLDLELSIMVESYREDLAARARQSDELQAEGLRTDLARALHLYMSAIDATPNLVVGIDETGGVRLLNRSAETATGYSLEEIAGSSFVDLLVPDDLRETMGPLVTGLLSGPTREIDEDSLYCTRTGKQRNVRWHFSRVESHAAGDIVLFAVGADVTDSLVADEHGHRNEKLAALGTLAAGLAHEIRNPLNGAQLHLSFLQRALFAKFADAEMLDAAAVVADEIRRLAKLVTEFLDFARPNTLAKSRIVVQTLLARVIELTAATATAAGIEITIDAPPQDLVLVADPAKLEQVLLNLVHNALEALTESGMGNIVVRARRKPRAVSIDVEDDGPGLSSPHAPIFDAFFSTKPNGTGLGLAITHRIVTDHGGTVDVESQPGRTCFRITLPIGTDMATLEYGAK